MRIITGRCFTGDQLETKFEQTACSNETVTRCVTRCVTRSVTRAGRYQRETGGPRVRRKCLPSLFDKFITTTSMSLSRRVHKEESTNCRPRRLRIPMEALILDQSSMERVRSVQRCFRNSPEIDPKGGSSDQNSVQPVKFSATEWQRKLVKN